MSKRTPEQPERLGLRPIEVAKALGRLLPFRVALRIEEAAESVGLSPGAFRTYLLPYCPKLYAGRSVVIPTRPFVEFVEGLALEEEEQTSETAAELLARTEQAR